MKEQKKKTYVLIVSRFYPGTHPLKGQPTNFPELIITNGKAIPLGVIISYGRLGLKKYKPAGRLYR
jgi:hypothetical protein